MTDETEQPGVVEPQPETIGQPEPEHQGDEGTFGDEGAGEGGPGEATDPA